MLFSLCACDAWGIDVAFFAILLLGTLFGVWRGFLRSVCKLAGTIFSLVVAVGFCVSFKNTLESWFGLETALVNAMPAVPKIASWISIIVSFIALVVLVRLLAWGAGILGKTVVKKFSALNAIDKFLGGLLGLFMGALLIFLLLSVCLWIPSESLHAYISESKVVGTIFNWDLFQRAARLYH